MLKDILAAKQERWWKSNKRGGVIGDRDEEKSYYGAEIDGSWDAGSYTGDAKVGEWSCVAAQRSKQESGQGQVLAPPPDRKQAEGGKGWSRLRIVLILCNN